MAAVTSIRIPIEHPSLAGHFPGQPILPGVLLLDAVARAAEAAFDVRRLCGVPRAKFLRPVAGGSDLEIAMRLVAPLTVSYEASADGQIVAQGDLEFAGTRAP